MYDRLLKRERLFCILTGMVLFISSVITFAGGAAEKNRRNDAFRTGARRQEIAGNALLQVLGNPRVYLILLIVVLGISFWLLCRLSMTDNVSFDYLT